jgi:2,4-dienoyl-CoA reductase-like NADH-dependent reductase (Old Yellow Enzyme family)
MYSSVDGFANDWHFVHLGTRAVGGAGLVFTEATAVTAEGRISPQDLGIWSDEHVPGLARIVEFVHGHGAAAGVQLAHAGRKASTAPPWDGGGPVDEDHGGWRPVAPSAIPFADGYPVPHELSVDEIQDVVAAFAAAAGRAVEACFDWIELHAAHGYLLHQFLSPLSNQREDEYGGAFENRVRIVLETVAAVREAWGDERPLAVRVSATDWAVGGWTAHDTVRLAALLADAGVDLVDCSSGGTLPRVAIPVGPGYQVPFAEAVRRQGVLSGAVGMITTPEQADELVRNGRADEIRVLSDASCALAEGELRQRADAWDAGVPVERYLERCELKTARLFEAACRLGALEAHGDADALGDFGRRIGLAFQLLDDVLDVSGPASRTGKHRGTDLLDGTVTLPYILARERDPELGALDPRTIRDADEAARVCDRIEATGALDEARGRALEIVDDAKARLTAELPMRQRAALELVANGVVARYA